MYIIAHPCGYCLRMASRDSNKKEDQPYLIENNRLPGCKTFLCEDCWKKIEIKLNKQYEEWVKDE